MSACAADWQGAGASVADPPSSCLSSPAGGGSATCQPALLSGRGQAPPSPTPHLLASPSPHGIVQGTGALALPGSPSGHGTVTEQGKLTLPREPSDRGIARGQELPMYPCDRGIVRVDRT